MAVISNGGDWVINSIGAGKMTLYDSLGNEVFAPPPNAAYALDVAVGRITGAITTGKIFTMRNNTTRPMYIRRIALMAAFDGTAAATTQIYQLMRFTTATPSGGTSVSLPGGAIKKDSSKGNSTLLAANYINSGTSPLTVTSVIFESAFASLNCQRQVGANQMLFMDWYNTPPGDIFILGVSEGLAINIVNTAVVGDSLSGTIEWDE